MPPDPDDLPDDDLPPDDRGEPDEPADDVTDPAGEPEGDEPEDIAALGTGEPQPSQPSRREDRIRSLVEENRRLHSEFADTRRRLDELTTRVATPATPQETPEQRAARLSLMAPEDRLREELREDTTRHRREMQQMVFQVAENSDRSAFQARALVDPLYKKWETKVEDELTALRRTGVNIERDKLLAYLIGKSMLDQRASPAQRRRAEAAAGRVERQRTRPADNRSDVQANRSRAQESLEKRLENVQI